MISDNFYPEAYSLNNGEISLTADVLTLADTIENNMKPYYLGYVSYENMPTHWKFNTAEIVDDNTVSVSAITQNYGWGFMYHWNDIDGSNIALMRPCLIANVGGTKTDLYGAGYSHHFVNHGIVASANFANKFRLFFSYVAMPTDWLTDDDSCIYSKWAGHYCEALTKDVYLSWEQIEDFLDNNGTITLTGLSYNTTSNTIEFKASDFGEDTLTAKLVSAESPSYTVFVQLTNMFAMGQQAYVQGDNTKTNSRFTPFFAMNIKGNGTTVADQKALVCPNDLAYASGHYLQITFDGTASDQQKMTAISYSSSDHSVAGNSYLGNLKFLNGLTQQDFRQRGYGERTYYWYADGGIISGKYIVSGGNTLTCGVAVPMEINDMRRIACFVMNKIEKNVTGSATVSDFTDASRGYTTDFTTAIFDKDTSNPLEGGIRTSKNFADLAGDLCLWQYPYTDLSVDKFTEDLIPEWTPPGPEPGDDDTLDQFSGDNISFNLGDFGATNGFITHWVMSRGQVSTFGSYVWQNLLDFDAQDDPLPGVWENLKIATKTYFTTGSVDPASLMELIVGLRYYPFDLENESSESSDNCIYFGTGKYGVPVRGPGQKTRTLDNMAFHLSAAAIVLPSTSAFWYKDFRDYEGSTAFIYLPFCGTYQIPISEIVPNTQFDIDYEVDLATGSCTAYVSAVHASGTSTGAKKYPVIIANGQCGFEVPLSATNANRLNATIIADAQKVVGAIAGPINDSAGKVISGVTSAIAGGADIQVNGLEDIDVGGAAAISAGGPMGGVAALGGQTALKAGGNLVNVAAGMATRSGCSIPLLQGGRGWSALANPLVPYIQIRRGRYMYAKGYEHAVGKPENRQKTVRDITGFFQCDNVDMSGVGATSAEVNMIKRMLETGVYHK